MLRAHDAATRAPTKESKGLVCVPAGYRAASATKGGRAAIVAVQRTPERRLHEPPRILIVEDNFLLFKELEIALVDAGFDVVGIATSGERAFDYVESRRPSLLLMDIRLTGQFDGIDVALEIYRRYGTRAIFTTAYDDEGLRRRAEPAKPLGWLVKPYTMGSLLATIAEAVKTLKSPH